VHNGDTATFTVAAADGTSSTTRFSLQVKGELVYMTIEEVL
jgi:hypothetical protein